MGCLRDGSYGSYGSFGSYGELREGSWVSEKQTLCTLDGRGAGAEVVQRQCRGSAAGGAEWRCRSAAWKGEATGIQGEPFRSWLL